MTRARPLVTVALALAVSASAPAASALTWPDAAERIQHDLESPDAAMRRAAADRLRTLTVGAATPLVQHALGDPDVDVRLLAARVAIKKRIGKAAPLVLSWLSERDARLRVLACETAAAFPDPAHVSPLARALGDGDATVRAAAASALGEQPSPDALPPLVGKLDDASPIVRMQVVRSLARLGDARAVVPLIGKAEDSVPEVRQAVAKALGELGDARAAPALVLVLRDGSPDVRAAALGALGRLKVTSAVDAISPIATDRSPVLRAAAVDALGRIGSPEAVRALLALLGSGDDLQAGPGSSPVREALVRAGASAVPALRATLGSGASPETVASAGWILGALHAREALGDVVHAMRTGSLPVGAALRALAVLGAPEAVPVVLEFLGDSNPANRKEALEATWTLLDPAHPDGRAVEPLSAMLRDPETGAAERARIAALLGRTGAPRAGPSLTGLLSSRDLGVRLAAIDALGTLRSTGFDAALLGALGDTDAAVRLHAAVALASAGGATARDALLDDLDKDTPGDRASQLTALSGILARAPSAAAIAVLRRWLGYTQGPLRDALILAVARANVPEAMPVLVELAKSAAAADRASVASAMAAQKPTPSSSALLLALGRDPEASVRAAAAWSLGETGGADAVAPLRARVADADLATAVDATAAMGRILSRSKAGPQAGTELCILLQDPRPYVRANAAAALALAGTRCEQGGLERRLLARDVPAVRAAAARAILGKPLGPADEAALEQCRVGDPSGSVARVCATAPAATGATGAVELYVEGELDATPRADAPFVALFGDGLLRMGRTDRRGAVFDAAAPPGDITLLNAAAVDLTAAGSERPRE